MFNLKANLVNHFKLPQVNAIFDNLVFISKVKDGQRVIRFNKATKFLSYQRFK